MKRTILLISMMLSSFICSAQTMLEEGNEWVYCHAGYNQRAADKPLCSLSFNKYFLNGTRTIEGREYHEIWVQCYDIYAHRQEGSDPDAYFHVDTLNQIHEPGLSSLFSGKGSGLTLGRMAYVQSLNNSTKYHEFYHMQDINRMGWANFYARTLHEYFKYGFPKVYEIKDTLEWNADQYMDYRNKNPL